MRTQNGRRDATRRTLLNGLLLVALTLPDPAGAPAAISEKTPVDFKQRKAYAVVIGISQYREEVIPKVAYTVKDAEAVAKLLETQAGIPKTRLPLIPDAKATS